MKLTTNRTITVPLCGADIRITISEAEVTKLRISGVPNSWWVASHLRNVSGPFLLRNDAQDAIIAITTTLAAAAA